jgi:hypothetical protein
MNNTNMNSSLAELINITDICKQNINCLTVIYFSIAVIFIISFILVGTFFVFLTIIRDSLECRSYQNSLDTTAQFFNAKVTHEFLKIFYFTFLFKGAVQKKRINS